MADPLRVRRPRTRTCGIRRRWFQRRRQGPAAKQTASMLGSRPGQGPGPVARGGGEVSLRRRRLLPMHRKPRPLTASRLAILPSRGPCRPPARFHRHEQRCPAIRINLCRACFHPHHQARRATRLDLKHRVPTHPCRVGDDALRPVLHPLGHFELGAGLSPLHHPRLTGVPTRSADPEELDAHDLRPRWQLAHVRHRGRRLVGRRDLSCDEGWVSSATSSSPAARHHDEQTTRQHTRPQPMTGRSGAAVTHHGSALDPDPRASTSAARSGRRSATATEDPLSCQ